MGINHWMMTEWSPDTYRQTEEIYRFRYIVVNHSTCFAFLHVKALIITLRRKRSVIFDDTKRCMNINCIFLIVISFRLCFAVRPNIQSKIIKKPLWFHFLPLLGVWATGNRSFHWKFDNWPLWNCILFSGIRGHISTRQTLNELMGNVCHSTPDNLCLDRHRYHSRDLESLDNQSPFTTWKPSLQGSLVAVQRYKWILPTTCHQ